MEMSFALQSSHNTLTPNALTMDALTADENVSFNDIFDDNMINEINNYESESSDDEYYVDPLRDDSLVKKVLYI